MPPMIGAAPETSTPSGSRIRQRSDVRAASSVQSTNEARYRPPYETLFALLPTLVFLLAVSAPGIAGVLGLRALRRRLRVAPRYVVLTARWVWLVAALLIGMGVLLTVGEFAATQHALADAEPGGKARVLAEGISETTNAQALAWAVLAAGYAWTLFWIRWQHRAPR
jgi:hypothetical protein